MHPVIRIVCFLVLLVFLARASYTTMAVAAAGLVVFYAGSGARHFRPAGRMLQRLRWLLVSLVIVYCWFTPGQPLWSVPYAEWLPTLEGMEAAALRVGALVLVVLAVNLLLQTTTRQELIAALVRLMTPLRVLGVPRERIAVRMALVLETIGEAERLSREHATNAAVARGNLATRAAGAVAALFVETLRRAEHAPCRRLEVDLGARARAYEWTYPLMLGAVLWWVA